MGSTYAEDVCVCVWHSSPHQLAPCSLVAGQAVPCPSEPDHLGGCAGQAAFRAC